MLKSIWQPSNHTDVSCHVINTIEILHIECECTLALLDEKRDKKLAKLQLTLNLFSAGKFKSRCENTQKTYICF